MLKKKIIENVIISDGYYDKFRISQREIKKLYKIIKQNFIEIVEQNNGEKIDLFKKIHLSDYHKYSKLLKHENVMKKNNRIIKPNYTRQIKKMVFFKRLKNIFNNFKILNFENIYNEEIDWRIVRPNSNDVSPLHRDEWFWSLNNKYINKNFTRIKIWIPILIEKGKNGLSYVPKSHLDEIILKNKKIRKDGLLKPGKINKKMNVRVFKSDIGQCFIFNDKLMHGGFAGGKKTRVSLEFTMMVNNKVINKCINSNA